MHFIDTIIHPVKQLSEACDFFIRILDFQIVTTEKNLILIENGALSIRLIEQSDLTTNNWLNLAMSTDNLEKTALELMQSATVIETIPPFWISDKEQQQYFTLPHQIKLTLSKIYNEDELGILPELPTQLVWQADARQSIMEILQFVPVDFRALARKRVTEQTELVTMKKGDLEVDLDCALQTLVETTPQFQYDQLKETLKEHGFNPENYFK